MCVCFRSLRSLILLVSLVPFRSASRPSYRLQLLWSWRRRPFLATLLCTYMYPCVKEQHTVLLCIYINDTCTYLPHCLEVYVCILVCVVTEWFLKFSMAWVCHNLLTHFPADTFKMMPGFQCSEHYSPDQPCLRLLVCMPHRSPCIFKFARSCSPKWLCQLLGF